MPFISICNRENLIYYAAVIRTRQRWRPRAKGILKAELARRELTYSDLADRLAQIGVQENRRNLTNKINRGEFGAEFLLQCLAAMNVTTLHLEDVEAETKRQSTAPKSTGKTKAQRPA
jgi:hypothetical protein